MPTLLHFHDPMCSWCWAFKPTWQAIEAALPASVEVKRVLGGLAPDTDSPMPQAMQDTIAGYWRHIETAVPGTEFNHAFWRSNTPRRATYPACRAVAAARRLAPEREEAMVSRIQRAYYLEARNPSDDDTLVALATELDFDSAVFHEALHAQTTV
ncbi:MAG: DsbA family protein, partial [Pseudomonadota bacterium]